MITLIAAILIATADAGVPVPPADAGTVVTPQVTPVRKPTPVVVCHSISCSEGMNACRVGYQPRTVLLDTNPIKIELCLCCPNVSPSE